MKPRTDTTYVNWAFKSNAIENKWYNEYKDKQYYTWAHRDEKADLDLLNKKMVIHLGLKEALSM